MSSWNQPVLNNKVKVSCSRKQRGPLIGLESTTSTLRVRRATHCATSPHADNACISCSACFIMTYVLTSNNVRQTSYNFSMNITMVTCTRQIGVKWSLHLCHHVALSDPKRISKGHGYVEQTKLNMNSTL